MVSNVSSSGTGPVGQNGPINIVPLYDAAQAKPSAAPAQLVYNNGPLLTSVQVFTIFWGSAWQQPPLSDTMQSINSFFDYILTSSLIDQLTEYSVQGKTIGHGSRIGTTIMTPDPANSIADSDIQQMLNNAIASNSAFPQPTPNTLYFVYLPSGVTVTAGGSSSCQAFCGYHDTINGTTSMQSCRILTAQDAQARCRCLLRSHQLARMNSVKQSLIQFPDKVGTIRTMVRSAISVLGRRSK